MSFDKVMLWISTICLGLFVNLVVGGFLSWSSGKSHLLKDTGRPFGERAGYVLFYWTLFIVSCILMGLGTVKVANLLGI